LTEKHLKNGKSVLHRTILFVEPKSQEEVIFYGDGVSNSSTISHFSSSESTELLVPTLVSQNLDKIFLNRGKTRASGNLCLEVDKEILQVLQQVPQNDETLYGVISRLRSIKTHDEIQIMERSCLLASEAHKFCMKEIKEGMTEGQIASLFQFFCGMHNYPEMAYPPICGTGTNAAILHYHQNSQPLKNGELLLCDMGVSLDGYCSDITSTFPVSGSFTPK
jgi:Xaa-Pro aminopeptidase